MPSLLQYTFPLLCGAAYIALWQLFTWNGSLDHLEAVSKAGAYPDGTAIRRTYTRVGAVDNFLTTLVAFHLPVTLVTFPEGRLFLFQFLGNFLVIPLIISVEESRTLKKKRASL